MPERILLVGSKSTIGKAVVSALKNIDGVIIETSNRAGGTIPIDLENAMPSGKYLERALNCDVLVIAAADFAGPRVDDLIRAVRVNSLGIARLISTCARGSLKHVVLISSLSAGSQIHGLSVPSYGVSKRFGEEFADFVCSDFGINLTILRPSQVYDNFGSCERHQPMLYRIIRDIRDLGGVTIFGRRNPVRNYVHLDDLVAVITTVVTRKVYGAWECVNPKSNTLGEIVECAGRIIGISPTIKFDTSQPDLTDIELGYLPNIFLKSPLSHPRDICTGIRGILESYQK